MKKDKIYLGKLWSSLLLGSCFAACAAFGGRLLQTGLEYKRQEADLLRMRRLTGGSKEDAGQAGAGMSGQNAGEEADWAAKDGATHWEDQTARLDRRRRSWEANSDTIGWISIPGTEIDYPVMYTPEDPDFYLNHGFDREPSAGGMIYLDAGDDCGGRKAQEPAEVEAARRNNFILYGHHMKNGTMFAGLEQYRSAEFFEEHRTIFFDMLAGTGDYEVFAVFCMTARKRGTARSLSGGGDERAVRPPDGDRPGEKPPWAERDAGMAPAAFDVNDMRIHPK